MRKTFAICFALLLMDAPAVPAASDTEHTLGLTNGWLWVVTPATSWLKLGFVTGVCEALRYTQSKDYYLHCPLGSQTGEVVAGLNTFYEVPENRRVPVVWAMTVVALRIKKGDPQAGEDVVAILRKQAAEPKAPE